MSRAVVALAVLLSACAGTPRGWEVSGEVDGAWRAGALDLAECVDAITRPSWWGGTIEVRREPFPCDRWPGDVALCAGSSPTYSLVRVLWTADPLGGALAHELAHAALCRVGGDCTEPPANFVAARAIECARRRAALPPP